MVKIEHPFGQVYRKVLQEKYPDRKSATNSDITAADMPQEVVAEALKRYYTGKKLIIGPRIQVIGTTPKQEMKRTITYV